jgi:lysophospholipase L1-like esterase
MNKLKLVLFSILFLTFTSFAQTYERAKMWDAEINSLTEIDVKQTPPKNPILFVGSSSMRFWRNLRQSFPNLNVINRGFGGSRLEDVNHYFDRIVTPYNPKIIVLYAGENDVNEGVAPETVLESYRKFWTMMRAKFPKIKFIYVSLKPSPARWAIADKYKQTNNLIKNEIAKDKRAVFVDVWTPMLGANGQPLPDIFVGDNLHMNEKGYEIWRNVLAKYLK